VPGSEWARERKGPGAKVPGSELARVLLANSLRRANWPVSEKAVNPLVHMRSISVHTFFQLFCSMTSVHAKYHFGTSLSRYWYIARERLSFC